MGLASVELFYQHDGGGYSSWSDASNPVTATGLTDSGSWIFNFMDGPGTYDFYTRASDTFPQTETAPGIPDVTIVYNSLSHYDIDLTGYLVDQWAFVSFAYVMSGNIETVLDDSATGTTDWDVAKWYDATDPADPWKTHRVGESTNDLVTIDHTMGVWIHLTATDGTLTTSITGDYSPVAVNINLYTGWNLVSYPSATDRLASTTLPVEADMVAYYDGAASYLITDAPPGVVTFSEGNAYWVHVMSDTIWIVAP